MMTPVLVVDKVAETWFTKDMTETRKAQAPRYADRRANAVVVARWQSLVAHIEALSPAAAAFVERYR